MVAEGNESHAACNNLKEKPVLYMSYRTNALGNISFLKNVSALLVPKDMKRK